MSHVQVEFDFADESGEIVDHTAFLQEEAAVHDVVVSLVKEIGPAGWPVYRADGEWANVRVFMIELYGGKEMEHHTLLTLPELASPPDDDLDSEPHGCAGWFIEHHRASGSSTVRWGPFGTRDQAALFALENRVSGSFIPLFLDVDWSR